MSRAALLVHPTPSRKIEIFMKILGPVGPWARRPVAHGPKGPWAVGPWAQGPWAQGVLVLQTGEAQPAGEKCAAKAPSGGRAVAVTVQN